MPMLMQSQAQIGSVKVAELSGRNEQQSSHGQKLQTPHDQDYVHQPWDRDQVQHPWDRDHGQHQLHDREQLNRDKMQQQWDRDREREKLNKFQSISNLLLDLPSPASFQGYSQDTNKSNNVNDMSITDLFGLGMPWGLSQGLGMPSFMNNQSTSGSPGFRNHQHQNRGPGSSQHYQCEDTNSLYSNSSMLDVPSSPNSIATPSSPSTTSSLYSNPYSFTSTNNNNNNNNNQTATSPTSRGSMQHIGSPASPNQSPYFGRPIRGSTPYSDCGSPTFDYGHGLKCNGSRSNSPADSETSGVSSMDGSLSDIMNCQSVNSPGYYPQSLVSRMSPEDVLEKNRAIALQRMRKYFVNRCDLDPRYAADRVVRSHQNAAALCNPTCTWRGVLPPRTQYHSGYSSKVFLGGVPWDITESLLIATFKQFGQVRVDWPGKDQSAPQPKGHVYIIFESEKQVRNLLQCCTHDFTNGGSWYYKVSSKRMKAKEVQVIPWAFEYSNFVRSRSHKLDPDRTVYVGALHGMLTASDLAKIMDDLFHGVIYAGIDTDKHKYPIGSGRVTFKTKHSYMKAVATAFVEIKTPKFTKKVQVDPYLEDSMCSECSVQQGPYFCRDAMCLRHFCRICWQWQHWMETMWHHEPLMRDSKTHHVVGLSPSFNFPEYHRALMNNAAI